MRHCPSLYALAFASLLFACNSPPQEHSDPPIDDEDAGNPEQQPPDAAPEQGEDPAIQFAPSQEAADSGSFQDEFGLLEVRDIYAVVDVPAPGDVSFVKFDIINPQDVLHQRIWRALSTDADAPSTTEHPETGEIVRVIQVEAEGGQASLDIAIPIAGTQFTEFGLTGTFTSKVWVGLDDGDPVATGTFTLVR